MRRIEGLHTHNFFTLFAFVCFKQLRGGFLMELTKY